MLLRNFPVLRLLIPYLLGIFWGYFTPFHSFFAYFIVVFLFFGLLFLLIFSRKTSFITQKVVGVVLLICQLFAGYLLTSIPFHQPFSSAHDPKWGQERVVIAFLCEPPQIREKTIKTIVMIEDQKVLLYIQNDSLSRKLQYGDLILLQTKFKKIDPPKNPKSFDYQKYMKRKGVLFTGYASTQNWQNTGENRGTLVRKMALTSQQKLSEILEKSGLSKTEYSVAAAILLGNDDTMEPDLRAEYSNAGVSHILCVSGMHVGIIFMILNYILMPLDLMKKSRFLKTVILFLAIWSYANITGLSPSVIRSATMFSFVLMGNLLSRKTNIFQSLYASLFIILIADPLLIFDLGFQLSYLAVFGIVVFQTPIAGLYKAKTKVGSYFWNLASVSLAAQVSTFPISIYYFHQFPNYFLLANLSVIFLSFCVMISGTAVIGFSFFPWLSHLIALCLQFLVRLMNGVINYIQALPGSVTQNIGFSFFQMVVLYMMIISFYIAFKERYKPAFFMFLVALLGFMGSIYFDKVEQSSHTACTVFSVPKTSAILFQEGKNGILLSDSISTSEHKNFTFSIKNYVIANQVKITFLPIQEDTTLQNFCKKGAIIYFKGKTILMAHRFGKMSEEKVHVDYVYLYRPQIQIDQFLEQVDFDLLIMDETLSLKQEEKWSTECDQRKLQYYSVRKKGAFSFELD